jgi:hypothetical protein
MMQGNMGMIYGMPVYENKHLTERVQRRKHKKKRINKKWLKMYGYKSVPSKKFLIACGTIHFHPAMKKHVEKFIWTNFKLGG